MKKEEGGNKSPPPEVVTWLRLSMWMVGVEIDRMVRALSGSQFSLPILGISLRDSAK